MPDEMCESHLCTETFLQCWVCIRDRGIEFSTLLKYSIQPSLEKVHGRFVVGFKTETEDLFILSSFTSLNISFFLSFSFFYIPLCFGGAFGPKDL